LRDEILFLRDGILGSCWKALVILQCFFGEFDDFFELRVVAADEEIRASGKNLG